MTADIVQHWREHAERCWLSAAHYRNLVQLGDRPGGRASPPDWLNTRSLLLKIAEGFEREAQKAEQMLEETGPRSWIGRGIRAAYQSRQHYRE